MTKPYFHYNFSTDDEYVAIIDATLIGKELEPITNCGSSVNSSSSDNNNTNNNKSNNNNESYRPSHLLPIVGVPCIVRLVHCIEITGFHFCIITITEYDTVTIPILVEFCCCLDKNTIIDTQQQQQKDHDNDDLNNDSQQQKKKNDNNDDDIMSTTTTTTSKDQIVTNLQYKHMKIRVVRIVDTTATTTTKTSTTTTTTKDDENNNHIEKEEKGDTSGSGGSAVNVDIDNNNTTTDVPITNTNSSSNSNSSINGSIDILFYLDTHIATKSLLSTTSTILWLPGDVVIMDASIVSGMILSHRNSNTSNSTSSSNIMMLLTDVGEVDPNTLIPIKETTKLKKGIGFVRSDDDIEYIALQSTTGSHQNHHRVIWKQKKKEVEDEHYFVGKSPKLLLPKSLLVSSPMDQSSTSTANTTSTTTKTTVRMDWNDVHIYLLPPWVRKLIKYRKEKEEEKKSKKSKMKSSSKKVGVVVSSSENKNKVGSLDDSSSTLSTSSSIQQYLIPFFISRQYYGIIPTFDSMNQYKRKKEYDIIQQKYMDLYHMIHTLHQEQIDKYRIQYHKDMIPSSKQGSSSSNTPPLSTTLLSSLLLNNNNNTTTTNISQQQQQQTAMVPSLEYSVLAYIVPNKNDLVVRINTISSYLYTNKEMVHKIAANHYLATTTNTTNTSMTPPPPTKQQHPLSSTGSSQYLFVPHGTAIKSRFHTVILPSISSSNKTTSTSSDPENLLSSSESNKVTYKSSVIGSNCIIGTNCRFNQVVVFDDVTIGTNTIVQNTIIGQHVTIGKNCTIHNCLIEPNTIIPDQTKKKDEIIRCNEKLEMK